MKEPKTCDFCPAVADACVSGLYWCDVCARRFLRGDLIVSGLVNAHTILEHSREQLREMIRRSSN